MGGNPRQVLKGMMTSRRSRAGKPYADETNEDMQAKALLMSNTRRLACMQEAAYYVLHARDRKPYRTGGNFHVSSHFKT